MAKAAAHPKTYSAPGTGEKKIPPIGLKNPSTKFHPNKKGDTTPGGMHGMRGPIINTLSRTDTEEDVVT